MHLQRFLAVILCAFAVNAASPVIRFNTLTTNADAMNRVVASSGGFGTNVYIHTLQSEYAYTSSNTWDTLYHGAGPVGFGVASSLSGVAYGGYVYPGVLNGSAAATLWPTTPHDSWLVKWMDLTNYTSTNAVGGRVALGLSAGTPQQAGTNLLTKILARNIRSALGIAESSSPPNWLSLAGIASCQTNETWTGTGVAIDTGTNWWGTQSIRIDALAGTARTASCTLPTNVYLQNDICLVLRVSDLTKLSQLRIRLYETAASAGYHYVDAYYLPGNRTNMFIASNSWIKLWLVRDHFDVSTSPTAWDDSNPLKTLRKIEIAVTPVAAQDVTVNIGEIVATRSTKMGVVLQTDDNIDKWYTIALPNLSPYGIPVTECTSDHFVALGAGRTTYAQLLELERTYGWQITSHTLNHSAWGLAFSELSTWSELDTMNKILGKEGFRDFRYITYPGNDGRNATGNAGDIVTNMMKGGFSSAARAVYGNVQPNFGNVQPSANLISQPWVPWDYFNIQRYSLSRTNWTYDPGVTGTAYDSGVTNFNHVLAFKGCIFPYTHDIVDPPASTDMSTDAWANFVAWCVANRDSIEFMTIGEYCDRMRAFEASLKRNYRYVY